MSRLGALIADGRTSEVFRFGNDGAVKILKPSTPQHWGQAEASYTAAVGALGVAAPEVRDVIEIEGRTTIVFARVDGQSMWQRMLERPNDVVALTRELAELQREIHASGVPAGVPSLVDRLGQKIENATELSVAERSEAVELLASMSSGCALLHGDLHPGNVLLSRDGPVVIDWFDATVGHPSADVARSVLLLRSPDATDLRHLPGATTEQVIAVYDAFLADVEPAVRDLDRWVRLRAAGRLSERTDLDLSGLIRLWRDAGSVVGDD